MTRDVVEFGVGVFVASMLSATVLLKEGVLVALFTRDVEVELSGGVFVALMATVDFSLCL